jgi:hypothetical protein
LAEMSSPTVRAGPSPAHHGHLPGSGKGDLTVGGRGRSSGHGGVQQHASASSHQRFARAVGSGMMTGCGAQLPDDGDAEDGASTPIWHAGAAEAYVQALGGASRFAFPAAAASSVHIRESRQRLVAPGAHFPGNGSSSSGMTTVPSLTTLHNSSHVIGLLDGVVRTASSLCKAGAYLHWWAEGRPNLCWAVALGHKRCVVCACLVRSSAGTRFADQK